MRFQKRGCLNLLCHWSVEVEELASCKELLFYLLGTLFCIVHSKKSFSLDVYLMLELFLFPGECCQKTKQKDEEEKEATFETSTAIIIKKKN